MFIFSIVLLFTTSFPEQCIFLVVLFFSFFIVYKAYKRKYKYELLRKYKTIDQLIETYHKRPTDFEKFIGLLYQRQGYKVRVTKATGDCGKDIIMRYRKSRYVVEVKLYKRDNLISRPSIQKLHSAAIDEKATGIFVTTSNFTQPAVQYAKRNGILLVSGLDLEKMISHTMGDTELSSSAN
ncbi:MAG: restriction endonuclease [Clostridiales bacterium]|nr:restriction endonuclease [Clostridiales bacterium]